MDAGLRLSDKKLRSYLERIGYRGDLFPNYNVFKNLHCSHVLHIPFENIDAFLARPVQVDLHSIHKKLILERRGGYCFEQNILFAAVLNSLGFKVEMLAARVVFQAKTMRPRLHMMLLVHIDGDIWVADVGFGAHGLLLPALLKAGEVSRQFFRSFTFEITEENHLWLFSSIKDNFKEDLYLFSFEPQIWIDYEVSNYYTSTHPDSIFTQTLTVQIQKENLQIILTGNSLVEKKGTEVTKSSLIEEDRLSDVLSEKFNIRLQPDILFSLRKALF